jgi:hypothetical protein
MSGMTQVQQTAIAQLRAQLPRSVDRTFVYDPARPLWVRVHMPVLRRNVDVTYDPDGDLYDVQVHDLDRPPSIDVNTRTFEGAYCDQLGDLMATPREWTRDRLFDPNPLERSAPHE